MTPFERLGYTSDTVFIADPYHSLPFERNEPIQILRDDGTNFPKFKSLHNPSVTGFIRLKYLTVFSPEDRLRLLTFGTLQEH